jgi:hypothetical protein
MMGFEIVVRPVVLPNIRPASPRSLPPADDPDKGFAVINGNGFKTVNLTNSYSASASSSQRTETKRRVDVARVYQKQDDDTVNKDNFVDIEVANKIWMKGASGKQPGFNGDDLKPTQPGKGFTGDDIQVNEYQRVKEKDNIKIKQRDVMRHSDDNPT